jgi:hypothetical protein
LLSKNIQAHRFEKRSLYFGYTPNDLMTIIPEEEGGGEKKRKKMELIVAVRMFNFIVKMLPCSLNAMPVGPGNQFSFWDKIVDECTAVLFGHSRSP